MKHLSEVQPGSCIRVRLQGHEDFADGVHEAQVDFVHEDHLMVWVETGGEDGFAVAVMQADDEGVWTWSQCPAA